MRIRDWNPSEGQAYQGDVAIIPMPSNISISKIDEIKPIDGNLILQEGELTGHNHAIYLLGNVTRFRDDGLARDLATSSKAVPTARLYRDRSAVDQMVGAGILTRSDLAVACLVVEGGPMVVSHEEHDSIRVPPGQYLIGRQVESAGAEERIVAD